MNVSPNSWFISFVASVPNEVVAPPELPAATKRRKARERQW